MYIFDTYTWTTASYYSNWLCERKTSIAITIRPQHYQYFPHEYSLTSCPLWWRTLYQPLVSYLLVLFLPFITTLNHVPRPYSLNPAYSHSLSHLTVTISLPQNIFFTFSLVYNLWFSTCLSFCFTILSSSPVNSSATPPISSFSSSSLPTFPFWPFFLPPTPPLSSPSTSLP